MLGIFFFLTIFVQEVLGYGALKTGVAFLPFAAGIAVVSAIASPLIPRIGARPLMLAGGMLGAGGFYWFSRVSEHSTYVNGLLGPMLVTVAGLGLIFVPLFLVAVSGVRDEDSGVASSLANTGQQVGGAIGLAALGTVVWGAVASSTRSQLAHAAAAATKAGHPVPAPRPGGQVPISILHHALATGISRGFLVGAGIMLVAVLIALVMIRVRRADLAGTDNTPTIEAGQATEPGGHIASSQRPAASNGRATVIAGHSKSS
jgi:hypothetical protein